MDSSRLVASVLADTNVISELARSRPNHGVRDWGLEHRRMAVSSVTISEIVYGFGLKPQDRASSQFEDIIGSMVEILPVSETIARRAGMIRAGLQRRGKIRTLADMLIAATALVHDLTLVTRNIRDFEGCGLRIVNPFR